MKQKHPAYDIASPNLEPCKSGRKWMSHMQKCDICQVPLDKEERFADAVYKPTGQWALMCPKCFQRFGLGIGDGIGQVYDSKTKAKLAHPEDNI